MASKPISLQHTVPNPSTNALAWPSSNIVPYSERYPEGSKTLRVGEEWCTKHGRHLSHGVIFNETNWGMRVCHIEEWPGQPCLWPGDVIIGIGGVSLTGLYSRGELSTAFAAKVKDGVSISTCSTSAIVMVYPPTSVSWPPEAWSHIGEIARKYDVDLRWLKRSAMALEGLAPMVGAARFEITKFMIALNDNPWPIHW